MTTAPDLGVQRAMAWAGPLLVVTFFVGFWVVGGYVPPPSPRESAIETARWYAHNAASIRVGLLITMASATCFLPWSIAIGAQLRRIDGPGSTLAVLNNALGAIFVLEFIFPLMIWQTAAFRPGADVLDTQRLNDQGWLWFLGVVSTGILQAVVIGVGILRDRAQVPLLPRWAGYLNIWLAMLFAPGGLVVIFKSGPFAWNGLLAWWCLAAAFCAWVVVNSVLVLRALHVQDSVRPG